MRKSAIKPGDVLWYKMYYHPSICKWAYARAKVLEVDTKGITIDFNGGILKVPAKALAQRRTFS